MASASGSTLGRRDLSSSIAPSLSDSSRRNTQQQPANSPHNVATRLPGRSALSEVDDSTYFEVLTNDILHLQQQLATLAHGTERAGRRLLSAGASYTERDLRAIAQAEEPPAAKLALHEILANKQMLYERAVLHSTAKSSSAPNKRIDDASEHVAPSLSRLPYFYALVERLQARLEQAAPNPDPDPNPDPNPNLNPNPKLAGAPRAGGQAARAHAAAQQRIGECGRRDAHDRAHAHAEGGGWQRRRLSRRAAHAGRRSAAPRAGGRAAGAYLTLPTEPLTLTRTLTLNPGASLTLPT